MREPDFGSSRNSGVDEAAVRARIEAAIRRARLVLFWERLWPLLVPPLAVVGVFLLLSLLGVWSAIPDWLRVVAIAGLAGAAAVLVVPLTQLRYPDRVAGLARVERATAVPHNPARAVFDRPMQAGVDPVTDRLWAAYRMRLLAEVGTPRAGTPAPALARRDPLALRYLLIIGLMAALAYSGAAAPDGIAAAFRPTAVPGAATARIDAWASPPLYTGRPPVYLTGDGAMVTGPITVPEGTEVVIRLSGETGGLRVSQTGANGNGDVPATAGNAYGPREHHLVLGASGTVSVRGSVSRSWAFDVIPDDPPEITLAAAPAATEAGALRLTYGVSDDYGITAAAAAIALAEPPSPVALPLFPPPEFALGVPRQGTKEATLTAVRDLAAHPYAGLPAVMVLTAADAARQVGSSPGVAFELPAREFVGPLAQALVEQRRTLALDAHRADQVALALNTLSLATPSLDAGTYLALRSVYYRLREAQDADDLRDVVDYLWQIAIGIEADVVADSAAALQAAADALRDALQRQAASEEIDALTERLRQAMQDYVQALAQEAREQPQQDAAEGEAPQETQPAALDAMLDEIAGLGGAGETEAAEALLDQFQAMMDNLEVRTGQQQAGQGQQAQQQAGQEALQQLGEMLQEQQRLLDESFAIDQQQYRDRPSPRTDAELQQQLQDIRAEAAAANERMQQLQQEQADLRQQLEQLMEDMAAQGLPPGQELQAAGEAMTGAEGALASRNPEAAGDEQTEALRNLRAGAAALQQQLNQLGQGEGEGQQATGNPTDPLGRPTSTGQGVQPNGETRVPEEIDRQRVREILDLIRQRLEELGRPAIEREYLERLLGE